MVNVNAPRKKGPKTLVYQRKEAFFPFSKPQQRVNEQKLYIIPRGVQEYLSLRGNNAMKKLFDSIKQRFQGNDSDFADGGETEYVQIDTTGRNSENAKVIVRPFVLTDFNETKQILDALRNQDTVALINIQPLKDKDIIELKRSINKLKKTVDAIGGDIAGFGDDYIVIAPSFATIWRAPAKKSDEDDEE
jgi:SepF-like predicted cell division protein (DUF552 family)